MKTVICKTQAEFEAAIAKANKNPIKLLAGSYVFPKGAKIEKLIITQGVSIKCLDGFPKSKEAIFGKNGELISLLKPKG